MFQHDIFLLKQPDDIIAIGQDNQSQHEDETHRFGHFHKLVGRLAACDDLNQEEENVTTVQGRNGQDVHHRKCDGEEGRHAPEDAPNPLVRENLSYGNEAAHALISLGLRRKNQLYLLPIVTQLAESL